MRPTESNSSVHLKSVNLKDSWERDVTKILLKTEFIIIHLCCSRGVTTDGTVCVCAKCSYFFLWRAVD